MTIEIDTNKVNNKIIIIIIKKKRIKEMILQIMAWNY